ncbi:MAG: hypothetical protein GY719_16465 [bacterium]|nr:hypothetical protein [bacterium]
MRAPRLVILILLTAALAAGLPLLAQDEEGNPPTEFDTYWMVFLERGDDPPELDEEASAELQRQHLAHLSKVHREGYSLVHGPLEVPPEETLRGFVLYRGDMEQKKVEEMASADPAVKAGRLKARAVKWWTPAGAMRFGKPPRAES